MPPYLALAICLAFVFVLLVIEKQRATTSLVLWVPTLWMFFAASRPMSRWFTFSDGDVAAEGSLPDRLMMAGLIVAGILILTKRRIDWGTFFKRNAFLLVFFAYMGLSVMWTDV